MHTESELSSSYLVYVRLSIGPSSPVSIYIIGYFGTDAHEKLRPVYTSTPYADYVFIRRQCIIYIQ